MPKDFAGRGRKDTRKRGRSKPAKRVSAKQRVLFHGPSFSVGALVGAAIVILAAYGPELVETSDKPSQQTPPEQAEQPSLQFEFPDLLRNMEVTPDPEPYAVPAKKTTGVSGSFSIQAASFKHKDDAERLRARLLLDDLPAKTSSSEVNGQVWYRVVVGPFERSVEADRAMTRLREQKLSAMRLNNHN